MTVGAPPLPVIGKLTQAHASWREGSRLARISAAARPPVGTTFSFSLNVSARISLGFVEQLARRRQVARGELTLQAHAGPNRIAFQGRMSRTASLPLGAYTVTIVANGLAGRSRPRQLRFTIVR